MRFNRTKNKEKTFMLWQSYERAWTAVHIDIFFEVRLVVPNNTDATPNHCFFFKETDLISFFKRYLDNGKVSFNSPRYAVIKNIYAVPTVVPFTFDEPPTDKLDAIQVNWLDCFSLEEYILYHHDLISG